MCIRFTGLQILIILLFSLISCKQNHYKVNTSGIKVTVRIKRLEQELFEMNPLDIKRSIPALKEKYNGFLQLFSYVINIGEITDSAWSEDLLKFCTDKRNNEVYASTIQAYPYLGEIENALEDAFRHYLYYFPGKKIPGVYTCISGFNNSIITGDSVLGIGLDRYLGTDCKYYPQLQIYKYQAAKMNSRNIVPDCMYAWASSEWNYTEMAYNPDNVLSEMIHEGKLLYFVKYMLPETEDSIIFGFSSDQMKFCRNNEDQMWQYLIENNLLFKTEQLTKRKLTGEAPFTSYFTNESPGRAAVWIGFRIVESYIMRNPGVSHDELMKDIDIQKILDKARYSPK